MPNPTTEIPSPEDASTFLPRATAFVMAIACAVSVANIYYNQPLLNDFAQDFQSTATQAGLVATAAQVGYGAGLLGFVPLGDIMARRKIVLGLAYACTVLLGLTALSRTLPMLVVLQLLVGLTAVSPQLLIPLAVDLTKPEERGRVVGTMMAGLLSGLLLARTVAGVVADTFGWRAMFWIAAALMLATGLVLQITLPYRAQAQHLTYGKLMRSLWGLVRAHSMLRKASLVSALSFASFCAFWAVLSFRMHDRFHLGATATGLFGVVGLVGALCAPLAGRLSDRRGSAFTILIATVISMLAFLDMYVWVGVAGLIVGVVLLDLGVQSTQVAAQAEVISLAPEARNRLNTIYMVCRFTGGAAGSAAGALAYAHAGWTGTSIFCTVALALALAVQMSRS